MKQVSIGWLACFCTCHILNVPLLITILNNCYLSDKKKRLILEWLPVQLGFIIYRIYSTRTVRFKPGFKKLKQALKVKNDIVACQIVANPLKIANLL